MTFPAINYLAVLLAAVASMAWGFIWYHEKVAGTRWMAYTGKTVAQIEADFNPIIFLPTFIGAIVNAFVLALFLGWAGASGVAAGILFGVLLAVGSAVVMQLGNILFEGRPRGLWVLYAINYIVQGIITGAIIGGWSA